MNTHPVPTAFLLDIGNTRIKATPARTPFSVSTVAHGQLQPLWQHLREAAPQQLYIAAGRSAAAQTSLTTIQHFARQQQLHITLLRVRPDWLALNYTDPTQFGIDRFLHLLAAQARYGQDFCVVSAGTAITLDFFTRHHQGGMILPGLGSARTLLAEKAGLDCIEKPSELLGNSTATSIGSGLYFGFKNLIYSSIKRVEKAHNTRYQVILTGGDAEVLYEHGIIINHLLFEGMLSYCRKK